MKATNELLEITKALGIKLRSNIDNLDDFLPLLEKIKDDGSVFVLKIDGERVGDEASGVYTIMISGDKLNGEFLRTDTDDLIEGLASVICRYFKLVCATT